MIDVNWKETSKTTFEMKRKKKKRTMNAFFWYLPATVYHFKNWFDVACSLVFRISHISISLTTADVCEYLNKYCVFAGIAQRHTSSANAMTTLLIRKNSNLTFGILFVHIWTTQFVYVPLNILNAYIYFFSFRSFVHTTNLAHFCVCSGILLQIRISHTELNNTYDIMI